MPKPTLPIEQLIANLSSPDRMTRHNAARQLGQSRDPRAVDALLPGLQDSDWHVRRNAAQALGVTRDRRAVEPLIAALQDRTVTVRRRAAVALGRIKDARAILPLLETNITTTNWRLSKDTFHAVRKFRRDAIPVIINALNAAASEQRSNLIKLLGGIGHPDALEALTAMLKDADNLTLMYAAHALGQIRDPRALEPLTEALNGSGPQVQRMIVLALGKLGDTRIVPTLLRLLKDHELYGPNMDVYRAVTEVVQVLSGMPQQFGSIVRQDMSGIMRALTSDEIPRLQNMIGDMISRATEATERFMPGGGNADRIQGIGQMFAQQLGVSRIAIVEEVETLIAWLKNDSPLTRTAAALTLPWYKDARALEPLQDATHDPDPNVRTAARWAFETLQKTLVYLQQLRSRS